MIFKDRYPYILILAVFFISGCWSSIPFTLDKLQGYISEKEQSFTVSARQLMGASAYSLKKMGFETEKLLYHPDKAAITATFEDTKVVIEFVSNTNTLTTAKSRITTKQFGREDAIEEELFNNIRSALEMHPVPELSKVTAVMIRVYESADESAGVIAYMKPGITLSPKERLEGWIKIDLGDKLEGYVRSINLEET